MIAANALAPLFAAIATIIAGAAPPPPLTPQPTANPPVAIGTAVDGQDRMTVPVRIGDHGPYRFLVDTGAQSTVLSTTLASELRLTPLARREVLGVAGRRSVDTVEIDDIHLGPRSYDGLVAPVLDARDLGADGIVGLDGLQGQRVLLDFADNRMSLVEAQQHGFGSGFEIVVTARRRLGQLILTHARIDGVDTDVIIDTGSDISIGNRALEHALFRRQNPVPIALHSVTGQDIAADVGTAEQMTIDKIGIANVQIAYADSPVFTALRLDRHPAMLLGMRELQLFRRVAIDFASRKVMFDLPAGAREVGSIPALHPHILSEPRN